MIFEIRFTDSGGLFFNKFESRAAFLRKYDEDTDGVFPECLPRFFKSGEEIPFDLREVGRGMPDTILFEGEVLTRDEILDSSGKAVETFAKAVGEIWDEMVFVQALLGENLFTKTMERLAFKLFGSSGSDDKPAADPSPETADLSPEIEAPYVIKKSGSVLKLGEGVTDFLVDMSAPVQVVVRTVGEKSGTVDHTLKEPGYYFAFESYDHQMRAWAVRVIRKP